ncbi:AraC family transcriptional regulator [Desulfosediminicola flagellatus]|uniref:AraC family transcriptional regulator n=1 Tax=Desulfosediminicola flagellatus TaxID=2569541 RepID=UPI0010AB877B|nr:AraC family transcriptional regulator [Desulfosediminicola flagellatus]
MTEIARLMHTLAREEGFNTTELPGVGIFKASQPKPREPLCYQQGVIIVGQGSKRVFLGNSTYEYNPDNYLVLTVPIPAECETSTVEDKPMLAMTVDLDIGMLNRIIAEMDSHINLDLLEKRDKHKGLFLASTTVQIQDTVQRLLHALQSPLDCGVIGPGIVHELIFRIMCGENASSLYALAMKNTNLARIDKALKLIHSNYRESMDVDSLAALVNMSPSAFHRAFKDVTASSPIQYLKKVRLSKAKALLIEEGSRVNEAATEVGYESAAQFSREFKRYFGTSPVECINGAR